MTTVVWSLLLASGLTYTAKWALSGDAGMRVPIAATLLVMVCLSSLHPWHNGWAKEASEPVLPADRVQNQSVLVFEEGVLTQGEHRATY
jgi:hypothetical protein